MNKFATVLLFIWLLPGCGAFNPITPDDVTLCSPACNNLRELGCSSGYGSPGPDEVFGTQDDISCEYICNLVEPSPELSLNLDCVVKAKSCVEYESCY